MAVKRSTRRMLTIAFGVALLVTPSRVEAGSALGEVAGGVGDVVAGVVSLPFNILAGTVKGPPVIGTLGGVFMGAFQTIGLTARGVTRVARGSVPLAMKAIPIFAIF